MEDEPSAVEFLKLNNIELDELCRRVRNIETGFKCLDRVYYFKTYPHSFIGSEAVDWIENELGCSRNLALQIGRLLQSEKNLFDHIKKEYYLEDDKNLFYSFNFKRQVVIVGGGFAGLQVAMKLEKRSLFQVTIVDKRGFFESLPSLPVSLVHPSHLKIIRSSLIANLSSVSTNVFISTVTVVAQDYVELESGDKLYYDFLILASGSRYRSNLEGEDVVDFLNSNSYESLQEKFENAKNITVIGGGPVGIEVVGEVASKYPNKNITIISQRSIFLERSIPKAHKNLTKIFTKMGNVRMVLGEKVVGYDNENKKIQLESNTEIDTDLVIPCTGFFPNTDYMKETPLMASKLTDSGLIRVNSFLQVEGMSNIFAAGDITNVPEEKLAQNAERHAEIIYDNIVSLGSLGKPTKKYSPNTTPTMIISLGPSSAMIVTGPTVLIEGRIASKVKSLVEFKIMYGLK